MASAEPKPVSVATPSIGIGVASSNSRAFATRVLADAESQGFLLEDVLGALGARRTGGR